MFNFKIITSLITVDKTGKFLLGKRSLNEDVFPGLWSIPGGKVEHGTAEDDVLEKNIKKEVKEEFGVDVKVDGYFQNHSDGKDKIYIIFFGHIISGTPKPLEDTDEVRWFDFEDIKEEELCPNVYSLLKNFKDRNRENRF